MKHAALLATVLVTATCTDAMAATIRAFLGRRLGS